MEIRKSEERDIPKCHKIYSYYVENTLFSLDTVSPTLEQYTEKIHRIQKSFPVLVGEENGEITGFVYLDTFNPKKAYDCTADLTIYLNSQNCHKGFGTLLLKQIEKKAVEYGKKVLISLVTDENEPSMNFHRKNGFEVQGYFPNIANKNEKWVGLYMFRKDIKGTSK